MRLIANIIDLREHGKKSALSSDPRAGAQALTDRQADISITSKL